MEVAFGFSEEFISIFWRDVICTLIRLCRAHHFPDEHAAEGMNVIRGHNTI